MCGEGGGVKRGSGGSVSLWGPSSLIHVPQEVVSTARFQLLWLRSGLSVAAHAPTAVSAACPNGLCAGSRRGLPGGLCAPRRMSPTMVSPFSLYPWAHTQDCLSLPR